MKNLLNIFMALSIFIGSSTVPSQSAHAGVGFLVKKKVIRVIGGIGTGAGVVYGTAAYISAVTSTATGWNALGVALAATVAIANGVALSILGLIVLDENSIGEFQFTKLENSFEGISQEEMDRYNQELDLLNMVKQTIESDLEVDESLDTAYLWKKYSTYLSAETVKVAEHQAGLFLSHLKIK